MHLGWDICLMWSLMRKRLTDASQNGMHNHTGSEKKKDHPTLKADSSL